MSARFCQQCKKTYTDATATFCEECGAELVSLDPAAAPPPAQTIDEEDDYAPVPVWKKYLPAIAIAVVVLAIAIVAPGMIRDNIEHNLHFEQADSAQVQTQLAQARPKLALVARNNGWFGVRLESVDFRGTLMGYAPGACQETQSIDQEIPSGGANVNVLIPLCADRTALKGTLEALDADVPSTLEVTVTVHVFGMRVQQGIAQIAPTEDLVKTALNVQRKKSAAADPPPPPPVRHGGGGVTAKAQDCDLLRKDGTCASAGPVTRDKGLDKVKEDIKQGNVDKVATDVKNVLNPK